MRLGVICEGITDYIAIREFVGGQLEQQGIDCSFIQLQPSPDNTDDGGWTRVFFWLLDNGPLQRRLRHFEGGLFGNGLDNKVCDGLIIQVDTDILDDEHFSNYMSSRDVTFSAPDRPASRADEVRRLLETFARVDELTDADVSRHVFLPAAESTEAWCIAAFERVQFDPELLKGQDLWNAFGSCLMRSEGNHNLPAEFGVPDKKRARRERYCKTHRRSPFLVNQAEQFRIGITALAALGN